MDLNLIIASRQSPLALWQTEFVKQQLLEISTNLNINLAIDILALSTQGDEILDQHLSKIGGKGLFTKALEEAIYQKKADCAVHSLKDMPMELPAYEKSFEISAMLKRHSAGDAFISRHADLKKLADMPKGAKIGTSSVRRVAFLQKYHPHLEPVLLRGNINTRLAKLENGSYDGIILAAAGLERLGLAEKITEYLDIKQFIPAPTQGILAIENYGDARPELLKLLSHLNHRPTFLAALAERQVSRVLGGSCHVPLAAYAKWHDESIFDEKGHLIKHSNTQAKLVLVAALFEKNDYHQIELSYDFDAIIYNNEKAIELAQNLGQQAAEALQNAFNLKKY